MSHYEKSIKPLLHYIFGKEIESPFIKASMY